MALAELASHRYETATRLDRSEAEAIEYGFMNVAREVSDVVYSTQRAAKIHKADLELKRVALQSRRPATRHKAQISNNPKVSIWVTSAIDATMLLALGFVVTALFIFLLELSAGRPSFLVPTFSAIFVFSMVSLVAFRLRRAIKFIQSNNLIQ